MNIKNSIIKKIFTLNLIFLVLGFTIYAQTPDASGTIYVKDTATGTGTGTSWADATSNLQGAINASGVSKVFVAIGTYTVGSSSFVMKNNVAIYGGFDPDSGIDSLSDERYILNRDGSGKGSILNGNSSKPVIWNYATGLTNTAILDGFTITNGRNPSGNGAGIHNRDVSPTLRNLIISNNVCYYSGNGAAMYNYNSSPIITNCYIYNNNAADTCGGLFNTASSSPVLTNVLFFGNSGDIDASTAVYCQSGTITCNNVTMGQNTNYWTQPCITIEGGSMAFNNSIIWGILYNYATYTKKYCLIKFLSDTTNGNLDATGIDVGDIFVDPKNNNYQLRGMSPVVNAGSNALFPGLSGSSRDLLGANRVLGSAIDLGAFEFLPLSTDSNGIVYVKDTATGTGQGDSWANATSRFQDAIDLNGNHQVWVSKGIYYASKKSFILRNGVRILGGFDPDNGIVDTSDERILPNPDNNLGSVLDGMNQRPVVWNNDNGLSSSSILDGFTITNGLGSNGGGIYNNKVSPTLRYLVLKNNTATSSGGGIYNVQSSPTISNTVFTNNNANNGGGIYNILTSNINISNCIFTNNSAQYGGGIFYFSINGEFSNIIIKQNTAIRGAGIYLRSNYSKFNGLLITENVASDSLSSAFYSLVSNPTFTNLTLAGNAANAVYNNSATNYITFNNSILFGGIYGSKYLYNSLLEGSSDTTNGNLNGVGVNLTDIFKNPTSENYTLKSTGPAINAGNDTLFTGLDSTTKDIAGNARLSGAAIDLGAYELPIQVTPDSNGIVYVCDTARGLGIGDCWENATDSLQSAINAPGTQKVFVAVGNYNVPSPNSFVMKNNVKIYGGFDPDNGIDSLSDNRILPNKGMGDGSVLNGKNERPVVFNNNNGLSTTAILDGFTIINGYRSTNGGGIYNNNVSPTLRNLVVKQNNTDNGGAGMYNFNASPIVSNVIFSGNNAGNIGGGVVNTNASPIFTNVSIIENTAITNSGALFHTGTGTTTLYNVTIAGNSPDAINISSGNVALNNSIVYGGITGTHTAQYSLIEGSSSTAFGNIDATGITPTDIFTNPTAGFYFLRKNAPVINVGSNALFAGLDSSSKDLLGMPRLYATTIDMGAYEYNILPDANGTIYVKDTATGIGNGTSWQDATDDLHNAIHSTNVQKVFVAVGNYPVGAHSFVMKNNVALYGGFDPDSGIDSLNDTRIMMDTSGTTGSILDGQNIRPVFWNVFTSSTVIDTSAILNGFTIANGEGIGTDFYAGGGGMRNVYASPTITNTVFRNNASPKGGGGMLNQFSGPILNHTAFVGNTADDAGGAILNYSSSSMKMNDALIIRNYALNGAGISNRYTLGQTFRDVRIISNIASIGGGGIENTNSSSTFTNSLIVDNAKGINAFGTNALTLINTTVARNYSITGEVSFYSVGGNIAFRNAIVFGTYNGTSIFTAQHSLIEGYTDTTGGNIDATGILSTMIFNNASLGDYTLKSTAVVINKGNNSFFTGLDSSTLDLAGNPRLDDTMIDMGAYEFQDAFPLSIKLLSFNAQQQNSASLLQWVTTNENNNKGFEIERSFDGISWSKIAWLNGRSSNGNNSNTLHYNYIDDEPKMGNNFYRLKSIDFSGVFEYSPVRIVTFKAGTMIDIFPNPTQQIVNITGLQGDEIIQICDLSGKMLKQIKNENSNKISFILDDVSGIYYVRLIAENRTTVTYKIVKTD